MCLSFYIFLSLPVRGNVCLRSQRRQRRLQDVPCPEMILDPSSSSSWTFGALFVGPPPPSSTWDLPSALLRWAALRWTSSLIGPRLQVVQGHVHHELLRQRRLLEDRRRGLGAGPLHWFRRPLLKDKAFRRFVIRKPMVSSRFSRDFHVPWMSVFARSRSGSWRPHYIYL